MSAPTDAAEPAPEVDVRPVCLVFMPMLVGYETIRATVAQSISAGGAVMLRLEEVLLDAEWQLWLVDVLPRASFVLVDLTDHNPFVMYELGLAHSRQLPALMIVDTRNERVSATVLGTPFLPYDTADLPTFERHLADRVAEYVAECAVLDMAPAVPPAGSNTGPLASASPYEHAVALLDDFTTAAGFDVEPVDSTEFETRLRVAQARGDRLPASATPARVAVHLLARVVPDADCVVLMRKLREWVRVTYSTAHVTAD